MRLIKMLGLTAVAAIAAMAFLGASSAMATFPTTLCDEASAELVCPEGHRIHEFHMLAGTTVLKTSVATVLCLHSQGVGEVTSEELLGNPLLIKVLNGTLLWEECGTNSTHDNCEVETLKLPEFHLLKVAKDLAEATALGAEVHVTCPLVNCYYGGTVEGFEVESSEHTEGAEAGMFSAEELLVPKVKGLLCPPESFWTALYEPAHLNEAEELLPLPLWIRS